MYKPGQKYKRHESVRKELKKILYSFSYHLYKHRGQEKMHTHTHTHIHSHSSKEPVLQVLLVKSRKGVAGESSEKALGVFIEGFSKLKFSG